MSKTKAWSRSKKGNTSEAEPSKRSPPKLTRVTRLDSIRLDETYFTAEGYFVDTPVVTSVGIFEYKNPDGTIRRELRLPEHVFDPKSLASYEGKPIIVTHEANWITERNVEQEIIGTILSKGFRDGEDVRAKIIIHAIREVEKSGMRELSLGYRLDLDETPGVWNGQHYDAIQTGIRINHLALVGDARAGEQARLNLDGKENEPLKGGKQAMAKQTQPKGKGASKTLSVTELKKRLDARSAKRRKDEDDEAKILILPESEEDREDIDIPGGEEEVEAIAEVVEAIDEKLEEVLVRRKNRDEKGAPETLEEALTQIIQMDEDFDALLEIIEGQKAEADFNKTAEVENEQADEGDEGDNEDEDEDTSGDPIKTHTNADGRNRSMSKDKGKDKSRTDSAVIDRVVKERLKLLRVGDRLNLDGLEDMSPLQMKVAIIKAVNPKMRLDGKGNHYIAAAYDLAVETMNSTKSTDRQRRSMGYRADGGNSRRQTGTSMAETARAKMNNRLMNGGDDE